MIHAFVFLFVRCRRSKWIRLVGNERTSPISNTNYTGNKSADHYYQQYLHPCNAACRQWRKPNIFLDILSSIEPRDATECSPWAHTNWSRDEYRWPKTNNIHRYVALNFCTVPTLPSATYECNSARFTAATLLLLLSTFSVCRCLPKRAYLCRTQTHTHTDKHRALSLVRVWFE